jgi:putative tryptophan/tyrosine transport system substrate-binding protein
MNWTAIPKAAKFTLAAFILTLYTNAANAWDNVTLVLSEDNNSYTEFANALSITLGGSSKRLPVESVPLSKFNFQERPNQLIVAVGTPAMRALAQKPTSSPVLNAYVSRSSFLSANKLSAKAAESKWFSAVFIDQPWTRQFRLIANALGGRPRVGVLLSSSSTELTPQIINAANDAALTVSFETISDSASVLPALKNLLNNTDTILMTPDSQVYNGVSMRAILPIINRSNKSLFGINNIVVTAGALSAVHSTPKLLAQQVAEIIEGQSSLPTPQFARYFTVSVNPSVARSLGLFIDDEQILINKLKQAERNQ